MGLESTPISPRRLREVSPRESKGTACELSARRKNFVFQNFALSYRNKILCSTETRSASENFRNSVGYDIIVHGMV